MNDICRNRHRDNKESRDANPSDESKKDKYKTILDLLEIYSACGLTSKEISGLTDKSLNAISGRLSELKAMGLIEPTGERREGAAVLRLVKRAGKRSTSIFGQSLAMALVFFSVAWCGRSSF
jgi:DNA-binding transcriptional ArsR family regulator